MSHPGILLIGVLAALASVMPASAPAAIGSYEVVECNHAPEAVNNSWAWTTTDPSQPDHYAKHINCPDRFGGNGGIVDQEGGLSTTDALGLSSGAPPGASAGWTFTAPSGTTIAGVVYERYIGHELDPFNDWSPALRADGTTVPSETCLDSIQNGETCFVGGPPGEGGEPGVITGLSAHELSLGIVCRAPTGQECITGATQHAAWAAVYGATVTISAPTPPTLGAPSGALWEPGAFGGFHKGTESVTVGAQDVGGGVQSIVLSADGQPVATYTAPCDFTFAQPCPSSTGPQTLTLPTTNLADGTHTLALTAIDAAGNQSTVATEQITVANNQPPAPVVSAGGSGGGGSGGGGSGGGSGSGPGNGGSGGSATPKAAIRVSETLRGRELVVTVSGPATGKVRVSFTGRLHGRTVAYGEKTVTLKHGRARVIFVLGLRTAAHAAIHVAVRLHRHVVALSTLRVAAVSRASPRWRSVWFHGTSRAFV